MLPNYITRIIIRNQKGKRKRKREREKEIIYIYMITGGVRPAVRTDASHEVCF